jgi:rare lipoprotein A
VAANRTEQPATGRAATTLAVAYFQVGAFGESINARLLMNRLQSDGLDDVFVHYEPGVVPALYRVRIGPVETVDEFQQLVKQVEALNVMGGHLVVEASPAVSQTLSGRLPDG